MDGKIIEEYGTKNKSNWFQTCYNTKSSFLLVRTPKSFFMGLHEEEKNTRFYQELCKKMRISSGFEGISGIEIQKRIHLIQVIIHIGFSNLLIQGRRRELEELKNLMDNV